MVRVDKVERAGFIDIELGIIFRNCKPEFRVLTPTMYRSRMASTRQTLSMDCGHTWAKPQEKLIQNEDSLDLELGASASHVDKNQSSRLAERLSERPNGERIN